MSLGDGMKKTNRNLYNLLEYIVDYYNKHSYYPSQREMANAQKVYSTSTIAYYLKLLEEKGLIFKHASKNRAFEVILDKNVWKEKLDLSESLSKRFLKNNKYSANSIIPETEADWADYISVPVVGFVTAGEPILAEQNITEIYKIPYNMFGKDNIFILNISGDSMINAGIMSGDKIVVSPQPTANNGDIVVAMIEDSATVKRFYKENGYVRLQPENDTMDPIIVDNVIIVGKVIGLLRNY